MSEHPPPLVNGADASVSHDLWSWPDDALTPPRVGTAAADANVYVRPAGSAAAEFPPVNIHRPNPPAPVPVLPPAPAPVAWYRRPHPDRKVIVRRYLRMKSGPCKTYYRRHVQRTVAKAILLAASRPRPRESLDEMRGDGRTPAVKHARRWFRLMLQLFRCVRSTDSALAGLCTDDDREVVRDILRYAIARCPYEEFRTLEGLEAVRKRSWIGPDLN